MANQYQLLMQELERERQAHGASVEELNRIKEERDIFYADLTSAQACINQLRSEASLVGETSETPPSHPVNDTNNQENGHGD